eukprot:9169111-Alexandrium_andersonii.AAC.1
MAVPAQARGVIAPEELQSPRGSATREAQVQVFTPGLARNMAVRILCRQDDARARRGSSGPGHSVGNALQ